MRNEFKLGLTCMLLCGGSIFAQDEAKDGNPLSAKFERDFKKLDANGDKKISLEEYVTKAKDDTKKTKMETQFKALDKDHDGSLTIEELSTSLPGGKSKKKKKE